MNLSHAALGLAAGAVVVALLPARRALSIAQAAATLAVLGAHLTSRVRWELDLRRPVYLASASRGEALDRGVTLLIAAGSLSLCLCAVAAAEARSSARVRRMGAATAALLTVAAFWSRHG